jgi:hypothetical protein
VDAQERRAVAGDRTGGEQVTASESHCGADVTGGALAERDGGEFTSEVDEHGRARVGVRERQEGQGERGRWG